MSQSMLHSVDAADCCGGDEGCTCGGACDNGRCCWLCTEREAEACCMTSGVTLLITVPPIVINWWIVSPWLGLSSPWGLAHVALGLFFAIIINWTYWTTVRCDAGVVRPGDLARLTNETLSPSARVRVCHKCNVEKPTRAHHCNTCGKCYHEFDHHCPFVANCVAKANRRFFIQFLFWAVVGLTWANAVIGARMLSLRNAEEPLDPSISIVLIISGVILLPVLLALICLLTFQLNLLVTDMTTVELSQYESRREAEKRHLAAGGEPLVIPSGAIVAQVVEPSKLGWRHNCLTHCGTSPMHWILPLHDEISSGRSLERAFVAKSGKARAGDEDEGSGSEPAVANRTTGNRQPHQLV
jgi:hypothetical protein